MQRLHAAREALENALRTYEDACLAITNHPAPTFTFNAFHGISGIIEIELELCTTFQLKTSRCKALLSKTRNSLVPLVPISSLPEEILFHIFLLVMEEHSHEFEDLIDSYRKPIHSLVIAQVCARWRQVALGSTNLWSNIDISIYSKIPSLREIFVQRSGDSPLNVRVIEPRGRRSPAPGPGCFDTLNHLFSNIRPRIASLEFALFPPLRANFFATHFNVLKNCLLQLMPGQCSRLIICDRNLFVRQDLDDEYYESSAHWFLHPQRTVVHTNEHGGFIPLGVDPQHYEDVLAHVKVLELDAIYPFWTSKAYHGLVELRLLGPRRLTTIITIKQLANILSSSPGLRVLHLGLEVEVNLAENSPKAVHLGCLEVFILQSLHYSTQQAILKLINTGSRPLRVSTTYNEYQLECLPARFDDEFCKFFRRSTIVELEVHGLELPVDFPKLVELLPNIKTLTFHVVDFEKIQKPNRDNQIPVSYPQLQTLHLRFCSFTLKTLRLMTSMTKLQKLTLLSCSILPNTGIPYHPAMQYKPVLMSLCPTVQFLGRELTGRVIMEGRGPGIMDLQNRIATAGLKAYALY